MRPPGPATSTGSVVSACAPFGALRLKALSGAAIEAGD